MTYSERVSRIRVCAIALSLAVHAAVLFGPWERLRTPAEKPDRLLVRLRGKIAERQQVERAPPGVNAPQQAQPAPASPQAAPPAPAFRRPVLTRHAADPKQATVAEQPDKADEVPPSPPRAEATPGRPADTPADVTRQQTTVNTPEPNLEELKRQYALTVQRHIQGHMVYPQQARKAGYEGVPLVRFIVTTSGAILPGSLMIARSCGYADLDASALAATQASAPFEPPPRQVEIRIGLRFHEGL